MKSQNFLIIVFSVALLILAWTKSYCSNFEISRETNSDSVKSNNYLKNNQPNDAYFNLKLAPFDILLGDYITNSYSFGLTAEKSLSTSYSINLGASYIFTDKNDIFNKSKVNVISYNVKGFSFHSELRKYFSKNSGLLQGLYWAPGAKFFYTDALLENYSVKRISLGTYLSIGYQKVTKGRIVYDFGCGIGLKFVESSNNSNTDDFYNITYHITDGGKKPYHDGNAIFPAFTLNIKIGFKVCGIKKLKK
jgi:hypothetical protein